MKTLKTVEAADAMIDYQVARLQFFTGMNEMEVIEVLPFIQQQVCNELNIDFETYLDWLAIKGIKELELC